MSLSVCILTSTLDLEVSKDILSTYGYQVVDYPCDAGIIVVNIERLSEIEIDARTIYAIQHTKVVSEKWLEDLQLDMVSPDDYIIKINDVSLNEGTRTSRFIPPENHPHFLQIKNVCQYGWIDPMFHLFSEDLSGLSVHSDDTGVVYDAYFTKVQLESNRNDFAHISLLYNKSNGYSYLFIREGRIGKEGTNNRKKSMFLTEMMELFVSECKKYCPCYSLQNPITSYDSSSYTYLPLGCSNDNMSHSEANRQYLFTLPMTPEAAYLTAVIHDRAVNETILNSKPQHYEYYHGFSYNYEQQPLLPLSRDTINIALEELNTVREDMSSDSIRIISNKYYSLIPTVMTGNQSDYLLNSAAVIEREKNRLNCLLQEDHSIIPFPIFPKFDPDSIPADLKNLYANFHCKIREINQEDAIYKPIRGAMNALRFTAAQSQEFIVDRIFELSREEEENRPEVKPNKLWLWHGTGIKNVDCILKQGLTDPKQTGRSGCGGIYFADNIAKSYQYVRGKPGQSQYPKTQPMFLCEVQCGNIKDAGSDFRTVGGNGGYDCVRGGGSLKPLKWKEIYGAKLALGMTNSSGVSDSNEYIMYNMNKLINISKNRMQVKLRYLVLYKV